MKQLHFNLFFVSPNPIIFSYLCLCLPLLSLSGVKKWGKEHRERPLTSRLFLCSCSRKVPWIFKMVSSVITAEETCSKAILGPHRKGEKDRNGKNLKKNHTCCFLSPLWRISARELGLTENHLRRLYCQAQAFQAAKILNYHETFESKSLNPRRLLTYLVLLLYVQKCFYS